MPISLSQQTDRLAPAPIVMLDLQRLLADLHDAIASLDDRRSPGRAPRCGRRSARRCVPVPARPTSTPMNRYGIGGSGGGGGGPTGARTTGVTGFGGVRDGHRAFRRRRRRRRTHPERVAARRPPDPPRRRPCPARRAARRSARGAGLAARPPGPAAADGPAGTTGVASAGISTKYTTATRTTPRMPSWIQRVRWAGSITTPPCSRSTA